MTLRSLARTIEASTPEIGGGARFAREPDRSRGRLLHKAKPGPKPRGQPRPRVGRVAADRGEGLDAATGSILRSPSERRVAEDRRDCYWLYVVTNCGTAPELQGPVKDPARLPRHEVTKAQHCRLKVDAMTKPMGLREEPTPYRSER